MKEIFSAVVLIGMTGTAYSQSSVTIYGTIDGGLVKQTGLALQVNKRDNNKIGFRGVEELGNGLKALMHLEMRFEPDTGTVESGSRPLFQGQSRVGLQGAFGMVRIGRGLTPFQESSAAFDPWNGVTTPAGFQTDITVAGYTSDPLGPPGNSRNRFSNAVWYNSPVVKGLQFNTAVGTREGLVAGAGQAPVYPYSASVTYFSSTFGAMAAYERNAADTTIWSVGASIKPTAAIKLMASYQAQDQGATQPFNSNTTAWLVGANYSMGSGRVLMGYGRKMPDNIAATRQTSLGYEYTLSVRTNLYLDASNKRIPAANASVSSRIVKYYSVGMRHHF